MRDALAGLAVLVVLAANAFAADAPPAKPFTIADLGPSDEFMAHVAVTQGKDSLGTIVIRLHHRYAPAHVANFLKLAQEKFYDGTLFHRTGPESFVQGGDPLSRDADPANDGTGGPGWDLEPKPNDKPHVRGAVAAAAMGKRDSGSQFFIDLKDHPEWDGKYTVFGGVVSGIEIADRIAAARRKGERPIDAFMMRITVEKRTKQLKL
jgi:peptidyl-prolyl cis-trans isomerase B (cyclophilin B)